MLRSATYSIFPYPIFEYTYSALITIFVTNLASTSEGNFRNQQYVPIYKKQPINVFRNQLTGLCMMETLVVNGVINWAPYLTCHEKESR